jgi:hypothetical protein
MIRARTSVRRLRLEIARCEVLCADCHQRHTIPSKVAHYQTAASTVTSGWRQAANERNAGPVLVHLRNAVCVDCGKESTHVAAITRSRG